MAFSGLWEIPQEAVYLDHKAQPSGLNKQPTYQHLDKQVERKDTQQIWERTYKGKWSEQWCQ